jgi:hypothetical protein
MSLVAGDVEGTGQWANIQKLPLTLFTAVAQTFNFLARQSDESGYFWTNRRGGSVAKNRRRPRGTFSRSDRR